MRIITFDLDGTLSPARGKISQETYQALQELAGRSDTQIWVVTGSPLEYIWQQARHLWTLPSANPIRLLPCNGTRLYEIQSGKVELLSKQDMRASLGEERFKFVVKKILSVHADIHLYSYNGTKWPDSLPLTGTFVQYRGSMINYCPIGRDSTPEDRARFIRTDLGHKNKTGFTLREQIMKELREKFSWTPPKDFANCVQIVLGGETSLDIYPTGWDKSYILNHIHPLDEIFFVGDKCTGYGNDAAIYNKLEPTHRFETTGPEETIKLIQELSL